MTLSSNATGWIEARGLDVELAARLGIESFTTADGGDLAWLLERISIDHQTGCWEWIMCRSHDGYGKARRGGQYIYAHRAAYEMFFGPVPDDRQLDHLCRNRRCCNPRHMEPVSHRENGLRGVSPWAQNARKTVCKHGHPLSDDNLRITKTGKRKCRACQRRAARESYRRKVLANAV